ncbi:MAG TPA: DUF2059 domain-containing protein [Pyrinomonadaceae bacterium]|nr:DUF2059 domain-containing protein [Pyrinomonadaceae bacterium]
MKTSDTIKQFFAWAVALVLICLGGCARVNSSKEVVTQKNLATQLVEKSEIHVVFAQSYVYGFRDAALNQGQPEKEVDCIVKQITPELMLPLLANVFDKKCSDDELRQAIKFYESETGKTYVRIEKIKAKLILGIATEEPPAYSQSDEDRIVAFEQTLVGKLVTSQDNSIREEVKETIKPKLLAIFGQCKKAQAKQAK